MKNNLTKIGLTIWVVLFSWYCSGSGNVDLSKAKKLKTENVDYVSPNGTTAGGSVDTTKINNLFSLSPNQWVTSNKLGGVIDPVGTSLPDDFDGDGIRNDKETTSNIWVADYPEIEAKITPPVTLKITILKTDTGETTDVSSDINSDDFESRKNEGSEKFHQNELAFRTAQYEKEVNEKNASASSSSTSQSNSFEFNAKANFSVFEKFSAGAEYGQKSSNSNSYSTSSSQENSSGLRTQVFEDRPFKNNMDRDALSVKADAAAAKARKYRQEKKSKNIIDTEIKPNAGYVRAALYIKNLSVNMPVRVSNILASLVFEKPNGELVPVQSFRLRNDDYSLFEVEIYGDSEFGPYVIELVNLNTVEVENAIALGYTPKIYIVDYKMSHVQGSNYNSTLLNYSGDNLKVIEENAKGRTALVKLIGPYLREKTRITAFDTQLISPTGDICKYEDIANMFKPGVSLERALKRLKCSGVNIEYEHFVMDFTDVPLGPAIPKVYLYGIKSINGVGMTAPCNYISYTLPNLVTATNPNTIFNGQTVTACEIKINDLTAQQTNNLNLWTIFDNGKYYNQLEYIKDAVGLVYSLNAGGSSTLVDINTCKATDACGIPIVKGLDSMIWPGDNYDITYLSINEVFNRPTSFGTNPLETGANLTFNTKWDLGTTGANLNYPHVHSQLLGQAGLGDQIEIKLKLNNTTYLNPNFGTDLDASNGFKYDGFSYSKVVVKPEDVTKLFKTGEAVQFELSMGLGGDAADWGDILAATNPNGITNCGATINFLTQEFTVCVQLPSTEARVGQDELVSLHLRPKLDNAFRNSIWPHEHQNVNKYTSTVRANTPTGSTIVQVQIGSGLVNDIITGTDTLVIEQEGNTYNYVISNIVPAAVVTNGYDITLAVALAQDINVGSTVSVNANLSESLFSLVIDENFFTGTLDAPYENLIQTPISDYEGFCQNSYITATCSGYNLDYTLANYIGGNSQNNNWVDSSKVNFLADAFSTSWTTAGLANMNFELTQFNALNFALNQTTINTQENAQVVVYNNKALVVWETTSLNSKDIVARIFDINLGTPLTGEFPVSLTNTNDQWGVHLSLANEKVLIVWKSNHNVDNEALVTRVFSFQNNGFVNSENIVDEVVGGTIPSMSVSSDGSYGGIAYEYNNTGYSEIYLRPIDLMTGAVSGTRQHVSTNKTLRVIIHEDAGAFGTYYDYGNNPGAAFNKFIVESCPGALSGLQPDGVSFWTYLEKGYSTEVYISNQYNRFYSPKISFKNSKISISWVKQYHVSGSLKFTASNGFTAICNGLVRTYSFDDKSLFVKSFNPSNNSFDSGDVLLAGFSGFDVYHDGTTSILDFDIIDINQVYSAATNQLHTIWLENNAVRYRTFDMVTNTIVGVEGNFGATNPVGNISVNSNGTKSIITWQSTNGGNKIYGRVFDEVTNTFNNTNLLINDAVDVNFSIKQSGVALNANTFVTWLSTDGSIKAREVDLMNNTVLNSEFEVVSNVDGSKTALSVASNGNIGMLSYTNNDGQKDVKATLFDANGLYNPNPSANIPKYGMNNFFLAPLIERNFEVTTRIKY